jgi:hypothetical protein
MAKEQQKTNLEMQKMQMEMAVEEQSAALDREKLDQERLKLAQDRELKLLELAQERELAIIKHGAEEGADGKLAPQGTQSMSQVINAVQMLAQYVQGIGAMNSAPKRIVRDPMTGDIIGVETVN